MTISMISRPKKNSFAGGIHPPERKHLSAGAAVEVPRYVERMLGTDADDDLITGLLLPPLDPDASSRRSNPRN